LVVELGPSARLPGERDLAEEWQVSRMTLRAAVDELVAEGLLERRHGSGTYVVLRPVLRMLGLTSFTQDMLERGLTPSSRIREFRIDEADQALAERLQVKAGAPIHFISRLRCGSGEPMAIENVRLPVALAPDLTRSDLEGSLYQVLSSHYGIVATAASMVIEPVVPDPASRAALGIAPDQACLRLRMVDADRFGRVVMIATCLYRGDRYQLRADLSGGRIEPNSERSR
jgi:GntR family transcriptional regulator